MYLLDTHYVVWLSGDSSRISRQVLEQIVGASELFVSPVTFQEIGIKNTKYPQEFQFTVAHAQQAFRDLRCRELPYWLTHAKQIDRLPNCPRDPLDRSLIAQALVEQLTLLSAAA